MHILKFYIATVQRFISVVSLFKEELHLPNNRQTLVTYCKTNVPDRILMKLILYLPYIL